MVEVYLRSHLQDGFIFEAAQTQCHFSCIIFVCLARFFFFFQKQGVCASMQRATTTWLTTQFY